MNRIDNARFSDSRWNFACYWVEYVCFSTGFAFANASTVLPSFVALLTDSAPLVGLAGTIFHVGWTAPQLIMARLIRDKPRKKPYMMWSLVGRMCLWIIALALWAGLAEQPGLMLAVFFGCMALFSAADGLSGIPWFDIMRRTLSVGRRGRLFGTAQAATGLTGIGVGVLVSLILDRHTFPGNYALLFTLFSAFLVPSAVGLALIREPAPEPTVSTSSAVVATPWLRPLLGDNTLVRLVLCRIALVMAGLATPFFVLHAQQELRLPQSAIGGFIVAQTLASIISSLALGWLSERRGPHSVIRIGTLATVAGPLLALLAHFADGALASAYPLVFVALGIANSTYMLGFSNYLLEIAPPEMCTTYVGVTNTIVGVLGLLPVAGGWLLEATSYPVLFGTALTLGLLSFLLALGLRPAAAPTNAVPEPV